MGCIVTNCYPFSAAALAEEYFVYVTCVLLRCAVFLPSTCFFLCLCSVMALSLYSVVVFLSDAFVQSGPNIIYIYMYIYIRAVGRGAWRG